MRWQGCHCMWPRGEILGANLFAGLLDKLLGLVPKAAAPATYLESTMGLLDQAHSFAQGASNGVASSLTGPVDGLAWLLRKAGVPVPQTHIDIAYQRGATCLHEACDTSGGEITGDQLKMLLSRGERSFCVASGTPGTWLQARVLTGN